MKRNLFFACILIVSMLMLVPHALAAEHETAASVIEELEWLNTIREKALQANVGGLLLLIPLGIVLIILWALGTMAGNPLDFPPCPFVPPPS